MVVAGDVSLGELYAELDASVGVLVYALVLEVGHSFVVVVEVVRSSAVVVVVRSSVGVDHSFVVEGHSSALVVLVHSKDSGPLALTFVALVAIVASMASELALALKLA